MPSAPLSFQNDATYLTSGQAARKLALSEARIRQLLASGALRHICTPLGRLIPAEAIAEYAASRAAGQAARS